jgi:rRNA maturation endonuclease Nob1
LCEHCKKEMPYNNGAICGHCGRAVVGLSRTARTVKTS